VKPAEISEVILVGGMTRMPMVQAKVKELFNREPHKGVNPDEVVAVGAAIQAGVLAGDVKDVLLLDVTPLTLGIETLGGVSTPIIERNTTIPTRKSQIFSTAADSQTSVEIHVLQGERKMAADNKTLGRFILDGIPPAPRGLPQIEVAFDIDANGIVNVSATDKATGKEQKIRIEASSGLSEDEINKMVRDAEIHSDEDRKRKDAVEARNRAENLAYQVDHQMTELGDKLDPVDRNRLENAVNDLKSALSAEDDTRIEASSRALEKAWQELGAKLHQQAAQQQHGAGTGPETAGSAAGPEVEADYEVVDDHEQA